MLTRRLLLTTSAAAAAVGVGAAAKPFPVTYSDAEWRNRLKQPGQFAVLRQSATEPPFTSPLLKEHRKGTFACAGCGQDCFASHTKFESGTGWPSFWDVMRGSVGTVTDRSFHMVRTAVHCSRCGGHLGHLFDDGPRPTHLRYCINGLALAFKPASA